MGIEMIKNYSNPMEIMKNLNVIIYFVLAIKILIIINPKLMQKLYLLEQ